MDTDYTTSRYRLCHIWIQTIPHLDTDYVIYGSRLYHIWIQTTSYMDTDYTTSRYIL